MIDFHEMQVEIRLNFYMNYKKKTKNISTNNTFGQFSTQGTILLIGNVMILSRWARACIQQSDLQK